MQTRKVGHGYGDTHLAADIHQVLDDVIAHPGTGTSLAGLAALGDLVLWHRTDRAKFLGSLTAQQRQAALIVIAEYSSSAPQLNILRAEIKPS